jgi:hypothetical protein
VRPSPDNTPQKIAKGAKDGVPVKTLAEEHAGVNIPPKPKRLEDRISSAALTKINKDIKTEKAVIEAVMFLAYETRVSNVAAYDAKRSQKADRQMTNDPSEII